MRAIALIEDEVLNKLELILQILDPFRDRIKGFGGPWGTLIRL